MKLTKKEQYKSFIDYNMSNEDYHAIDGISSTLFQDMELSIAIFKNRDIFKYDCEAFKIGNLIHVSLLEPHLLDNFIECNSLTLNTNEAENFIKAHPDKIVVPKNWIERAKEMAKKTYLIYNQYINLSKKEVSVCYYNEDIKLYCKCRPDMWIQDSGLILDLKSSKETTPKGFESTIEKYNYHVSAAWYIDTCNLIIDKLKLDIPKVTTFRWLVAPKFAPHKPFGLECSQELLEKGRSKYQDLINKYIEVENGGIDHLFSMAHSYEYRKENY